MKAITIAIITLASAILTGSAQHITVDAPWIDPFVPLLKQGATGEYTPPKEILLRNIPGTSPKAKIETLLSAYRKHRKYQQWVTEETSINVNEKSQCLRIAVGIYGQLFANKKSIRGTPTLIVGRSKNEDNDIKHAWVELILSSSPGKRYVLDPIYSQYLVDAETYYAQRRVFPVYEFGRGRLLIVKR